MPVTSSSRRALLRGLISIGAAGFAAACRDQADRQPAPPSSSFVQVPTPGGTTVRPRDLKGTISIAYADELGKKPPYINEAAAELQRVYADVTVEIRQVRLGGSEFFDQLLPSLSAEEAPDIIHVGGDRLGELADAGLVAPLDEFLREWPDWRYYSPTVREGVTYQGQVWALPYGLDTRFLYFRRDIFEQVGLGSDWSPKNVADILSAASRVKMLRPDVLPYALYAGPNGGSGTANHGFVPLVYAYGGSLKDVRGNWIGDSPAIRKAFGYYAMAYQGERLSPIELLTMPRSWVSMRERLGDGSLAMLFEGGWVYGGWSDKDR
ncbi:MAG: ABC transporter substrate-binding protein, partial [Dehalococcoidia bacterium]